MTSVNREIAAIADRLITDCTPACCSAARPSWSRLNEFRPAVYRHHGRCRAPRAAGYDDAPGAHGGAADPVRPSRATPSLAAPMPRRPTPAGVGICADPGRRPHPPPPAGAEAWSTGAKVAGAPCRRAVRPRPVPAGRPAALDGPGAGTLRATALAHDVLERSAACRGRSARLNKLPPAGSTGCVPAGDRRDRRAGGSAPNAMKVLRVGRGKGPQQQGMA